MKRFEIITETDARVLDRGETAVRVGAHAQPLPARRAMADGTEHLLTPQHQFHRPPGQFRGEDAEHLRALEQALAAETAAEERAADVDLVG